MSASIADRFEEIVDERPAHDAINWPNATLTYAELDARANQCAAWLQGADIGAGDTVGLALSNRPEHVELLMGAFKIGAVPININTHYTAREFNHVIRDSGTRIVVHETDRCELIADRDNLRSITIGPAYEECLRSHSPERVAYQRDGSNRYVLYTGGSTGIPKGVVWRQDDLTVAVLAPNTIDAPAGRVLIACPLTHGTGQWTALAALIRGSTVLFDRPGRLDAASIWSRIERTRASRLVIVGDAFARPLLDALDREPHRWDLSSLVAITSGGARWSESTRRGLLEHLPQVAMVNTFGATETGGQGSQVTFAGQTADQVVGLLRFTPDSTSVVLDEHLEIIPPGSPTIGQLARRGPIPLGYLGDMARTERTFPVVNGVRFAIPGDLATVEADGTIVVLGRTRNVINTGGEKVFAEEVEGRLIRHRAVADAVVVGLPDTRWGERIVALVQLHPNATVSTDELIEHCATHLARFKVPRVIEITDRIHRLANGKLDRAWAADTMSGTATPERPSDEP